MDKNRFTEYSQEVEPGIECIVQVPDDKNIPVQIHIKAGGKVLFMGVNGFVATVDLVARALADAGVEITLPQAVK